MSLRRSESLKSGHGRLVRCYFSGSPQAEYKDFHMKMQVSNSVYRGAAQMLTIAA
jgi:hypothetical protein